MDLWVLAGQSNMVGAAPMQGPDTASSRIKIFNLNDKWVSAQEPVHRLFEANAAVYKDLFISKNPGATEQMYEQYRTQSFKKPIGTVGPGLPFAKHLAKYISNSIGLIPCAFGGSTMDEWSPSRKDKGEHSLYAVMLQRMQAVGGNIKGVLWYQGESEAMAEATAPIYDKTFMGFLDTLRKDCGQSDLPVITVQISRFALDYDFQNPWWEQVRECQRRVSLHASNLYMTSAIDLELGDAIHLSYEAQQQLGRRLAEVALSKVYGIRGHGTPIALKSVEHMEPHHGMQRLKVHFSGVSGSLRAPGRATGFSMRSKIPNQGGPAVFRVEFDRKDPASVIIWYSPAIKEPVSLYYGTGICPFVNIVDSKDMPLPAFGPIEVA